MGVAGTFRIPFAGGGARSAGRGPTVGDLGPAEQHDAAPLTRRLVSRIPLHIGFAGEDDRVCRRTNGVDLVAAIERQIRIAGGCEYDDPRIAVQRGDRISCSGALVGPQYNTARAGIDYARHIGVGWGCPTTRTD